MRFTIFQLIGAITVVGLFVGRTSLISDVVAPIGVALVASSAFVFVDAFRGRRRRLYDSICITLVRVLICFAAQLIAEKNRPAYFGLGGELWPSPILVVAAGLAGWYGDEIVGNLKNIVTETTTSDLEK